MVGELFASYFNMNLRSKMTCLIHLATTCRSKSNSMMLKKRDAGYQFVIGKYVSTFKDQNINMNEDAASKSVNRT